MVSPKIFCGESSFRPLTATGAILDRHFDGAANGFVEIRLPFGGPIATIAQRRMNHAYGF
jgi:hypothetical protein